MQRGRGGTDAGRGAGVGISPLQVPVTAIIAAGGRGDRAGSSTPKQFTTLAGKPLVAWSLDALQRSGCSPLVLVVPDDFVDEASALARNALVVVGGPSRQASVANGLASVETDVVVVHDAARPFVDAETVAALVAALGDSDGVVPVVPVGETIKEVEGTGVRGTVDRTNLFLSQTPQLFRTTALRAAHARAHADGIEGTDDAQLIERNGGSISTVPGSRKNIKLTFPEDFDLAERMADT